MSTTAFGAKAIENAISPDADPITNNSSLFAEALQSEPEYLNPFMESSMLLDLSLFHQVNDESNAHFAAITAAETQLLDGRFTI